MKNTWLSVGLVVCLMTVGSIGWADETEGGAQKLDDAALIVIDIQAFYFPEGMVPLKGPEAAAKQAARVIAAFRAAGRPVIHVQHLPKDVDTPDPTGIQEQYRIHADVLPAKGEIVVGKHHANSFRDTELLAILRELGVETLVVTGMQTHMCVEAAVRAAHDLGFTCMLASDACATRALQFEEHIIPAASVHYSTLNTLQGSYAKVATTEAIISMFSESDP